jgi:hypothetical protein
MRAGQAGLAGLAAVLVVGVAGCGGHGSGAGQVEARLYDLLRQGRHVRGLLPDGSGLALWAHQVDGQELHGVVLKHHDASGTYDLIVSARDGAFQVDTERQSLLIHLRAGAVRHGDATAQFEDRVLELPFEWAPTMSRD